MPQVLLRHCDISVDCATCVCQNQQGRTVLTLSDHDQHHWADNYHNKRQGCVIKRCVMGLAPAR